MGRIGIHNIVIAVLPAGMYGQAEATATATHMVSSFPQIRLGLMVGIGGGIPRPDDEIDIRLGDVVISQPSGTNGGVAQYDVGKARAGGKFELRGFLSAPPLALLNAVAHLKSQHERRDSKIPEIIRDMLAKNLNMAKARPGRPSYDYQGKDHDRLFDPEYNHQGGKTCKECDTSQEIPRDERKQLDPAIHYSLIASGNAVIKDAATRHKVVKRLGPECLCVETEAAGLMNNFPCFVVRGICDYAIKTEVHSATTAIQQSERTIQKAIDTGKEVADTNKTVITLVRQVREMTAVAQAQPVPKTTYASVVARSGLAASMHNRPTSKVATPFQAVREIIVKITEPSTIESIRAMNPRTLKAHVEQSKNEHVNKIKAASANQLKSGDLSVKTTTAGDTEALRQFAEDWAHRIGKGASVRIPTYGALAHGIRTSSMDMEQFEAIKTELLQDNRPFIPMAEIKSGEVFRCEKYDRQCRLKRCFKCQKYGHIGTQCKATIACGYCAQEHNSRDCPSKSDTTIPKKCTNCSEGQEAWNQGCRARRKELAKIRTAHEIREPYYRIPERKTINPTEGQGEDLSRIAAPRRQSQTIDLTVTRETRITQSMSSIKRGHKRANTCDISTSSNKENETAPISNGNSSSQRPLRALTPARRILETINANPQLRLHNSQPMELDRRS